MKKQQNGLMTTMERKNRMMKVAVDLALEEKLADVECEVVRDRCGVEEVECGEGGAVFWHVQKQLFQHRGSVGGKR